MTSRLWTGFALTLLAGLLAGNCRLPMKFARRWPWESVWLVFSIVSLLVLPWTLAFIMIANRFAVLCCLTRIRFRGASSFWSGMGRCSNPLWTIDCTSGDGVGLRHRGRPRCASRNADSACGETFLDCR
jgi:L-rhamnose-proton symport protein (RhaT)